MKQQIMSLTFATGALILATQHAFGQGSNACADRATIVNQLAERYGETRHALGITGNNSVFEVFASDNTATWTILVSLPDGRACLVAIGEAFEAASEALQPTGLPL